MEYCLSRDAFYTAVLLLAGALLIVVTKEWRKERARVRALHSVFLTYARRSEQLAPEPGKTEQGEVAASHRCREVSP